MSVKHIENLTITNFKCFKHLEVMNIGKVNLIGGKNNVGKTAFLEAVELLALANAPLELAHLTNVLLTRRQGNLNDSLEIDFFGDDTILRTTLFSEPKTCIIERYLVPLHTHNKDEIYDVSATEIFVFRVNGDEINVSIDSLSKSSINTLKKIAKIYIPTSKINELDIAISFGKLIDSSREYFLNTSLSLFDNNIIELKQTATERGVTLKLKLKNKDKLVLLSSLGEGINRYIAILCAIWANKDGVLLIDEIENGIHYTNHKKLWEIIFQASVDANCQLFITSHSKECLSAFNDVQFEIENCSSQYYEFYRNLKTDLITASARDKEQLRYALTHEGRIRGE